MSTGMRAKDDDVSGRKAAGGGRRIAWIDIAKALAMILVFYGHLGGSGDNPWFPDLEGSIWVVYLFHMPLFLMLSGLTFNPDKPFRQFLVARVKRLLIPYFFFSLYAIAKILVLVAAPSVFASFHAADMGSAGSELLRIVLGQSFGLWFFWALFWSELVLYGFHRLTKGWAHARIALWALALACAYVWFYFNDSPLGNQLPFQLLRGVEGVAFVAFGWLLASWVKQFAGRKSVMLLAASVVAFVLLACFLRYGGTDGALMAFARKTAGMLAALAGSLMVMAVSQLLPAWRWLLSIGRNTMVYYGLNGLSLAIAKKAVFLCVPVAPVAAHTALQVAVGLLTVAVACGICAVATPILNRWCWWGIGLRRPRRKTHAAVGATAA